MLLKEHREELQAFMNSFVKRTIPVMAHNADGLASDYVLDAHLDAVMHIASAALDRFCYERNSLVPINRLPVEVILHVASFLPYAALSAATHVCKQWKRILNDARCLWDDITLSTAALGPATVTAVEAAFKQCGGNPSVLCLQWSYCTMDCPRLGDIVSTTLHSLAHLCLSVTTASCPAFIGILTSPAPVLRTLTLISPSGGPVIQLPCDLFNGIAPKLSAVYLSNIVLPAQAGSALHGVTEFAYFDLTLMTVLDIEHALAACPKLEYLTLGAREYEIPSSPRMFEPPQLRGLGVVGIVDRGIVERIVRRNTSNFALHLLWPTPMSRALAFCRSSTIKRVYVFLTPAADNQGYSGSLILTGDDDNTVALEYDWAYSILDLIGDGMSQLETVETLTISDSILAMLLASGRMGRLRSLHTLTILVTNDALAPYPRMFCFDGETRFPEWETLHTVRLASSEQYVNGFQPEHDAVLLSTRIVRSWLPTSTKTLLLCGVRLDDATITDPVIEYEWDRAEPGERHLLAGWHVGFPTIEALRV
ncbi:hypothetical protein EXIGLDRAFT_845430 [Exidia glandulosa HHB12029]|uniref:F-box domain-containing protein n=1 Tax=Exidia glandulosa HHB12029 TaxID=1314781 RepID=A0A165BG20_EXIGL|nr:hypothetical protein EXIGLDRAFT_845430 [Exidia glandulosa HHB12029]